MIKIIWMSNFRFSDYENSGSGTWIEAMGRGVSQTKLCRLINITLGDVRDCVEEMTGEIKQYVLPQSGIVRKPYNALPPSKIILEIERIIQEECPDIIHVWGSERFWGRLTGNNKFRVPVLLEMQGVTSAMVAYMTGCLTLNQQIKCIGFKELLRPNGTMWAVQRRFERNFVIEREIIKSHTYVDYQSDWVLSCLKAFGYKGNLFKTRMVVKNEYLKCNQWELKERSPVVYTNCGCVDPAKGLHVLIKAIDLLKVEYPDIELRVAGALQYGIRRCGYAKQMIGFAQKKGLNIKLLGRLTPTEQIMEMRSASVAVVPSLVESYSMSLAEMLAVGCPCVASYAGAMPEVGGDACLYFPIADSFACAGCIRMLLNDSYLAEKMSDMAIRRSRSMHAPEPAIKRQIEIYQIVLNGVGISDR